MSDEFVPWSPTFERLRTVIMRQGEPDRVPNVELHVDWQVKQAFLGHPLHGVQDDVDFWYRAGYDYIYLRANYEYRMVGDGHAKQDHLYAGDMQVSKWEGEETSLISTWAGVRSLPLARSRAHRLQQPGRLRPPPLPGMKIISGVGGIFTRVWRIMGFETFCYALADQPDLVAAVLQAAWARRSLLSLSTSRTWTASAPCGRATTWPTPPARWFRPMCCVATSSPTTARWATSAARKGLPYILHTDGNLWQVMDDLVGLRLQCHSPDRAQGHGQP